MNTKKTIRFVVLVIIIFSTTHNVFSQSTLEQAQQFAEAMDSPKNVTKALASVPYVSVMVPRLGSPFFEEAYGSAVEVNSGTAGVQLVFTAAHVFPPYRELICGKGTRVTLHFHGDDVAGRVVYLNKESDLAVIRFESRNPNIVSYLKVAEKDPEIGEELFAIGYPPISSSLQTVIGVRFRGFDIFTVDQQIDPHVFVPFEVQHFVLWTGAEMGYSGGPLINKHGEVQGILIELSSHGSFMYAVARRHILEALNAIQSGQQEFCQ